MTPTTTHEPHPVPPPPPFFFSTDLEDDEADVDLEDDDELDLPEPPEDDEDTVCEAIEFCGEGYTSLANYFVRELEEFVDESIAWILTTLDMAAVQRRFEGSKYRYCFEQGAVYRVGLRAAPRPPAGDDPPGPTLPTRGC